MAAKLLYLAAYALSSDATSTVQSVSGTTHETFGQWAHSDEFVTSGARCHTPEPTEEEVQTSNMIIESWSSEHACPNVENPTCLGLGLTSISPKEIPTYWHEINNAAGEGD